MKVSAEPRSDQWNADDFINGKAKVFTIADVKPGKAEQKYDIILAEGDGRVWRPPLTVIRILIDAWGDESDDWTGRQVALYREPSVTFGREKPGGIRISHMSHLPDGKPLEHEMTVSRGRKQRVTIKPLQKPPAPDSLPPIPAETVAEFEQRITDAATVQDLNVIAADLKAWDLGAHRSTLLAAYGERKTAIESGPVNG